MGELQAVELLAVSLALAVSLISFLIIVNCLHACCRFCKARRRKSSDVECLPENYVEEIHRLLDRHKKVMNDYDWPLSEESNSPKIAESLCSTRSTPVRNRSRSCESRNSERLHLLKEELEAHRIETDSNQTEKSSIQRSPRPAIHDRTKMRANEETELISKNPSPILVKRNETPRTSRRFENKAVSYLDQETPISSRRASPVVTQDAQIQTGDTLERPQRRLKIETTV